MKKIKILQIEDDALYSEVLKDILEDYEIQRVRTGKEALEILSSNQDFDLIICDYSLPEFKGKDLVPKIKSICNIPIIANSNLSSYCIKMVEAGANSYIVKDMCKDSIHQWKNIIEKLIH